MSRVGSSSKYIYSGDLSIDLEVLDLKKLIVPSAPSFTLQATVVNHSNIPAYNFASIAYSENTTPIYTLSDQSIIYPADTSIVVLDHAFYADDKNNAQDFCLEIIEANGLSDIDLSNNLFCEASYATFKMLNLFPNPAEDVLNLELYAPENLENNSIAIYNVKGQIKATFSRSLHQGINTISYNIEHLTPGQYILKVFNADTPLLEETFNKASRSY